ncbi:MAG: hypothetical protein IJ228_11300 [Succinivibrio sp.]|nr:hypothetical protein [Succinivibrio sp.]
MSSAKTAQNPRQNLQRTLSVLLERFLRLFDSADAGVTAEGSENYTWNHGVLTHAVSPCPILDTPEVKAQQSPDLIADISDAKMPHRGHGDHDQHLSGAVSGSSPANQVDNRSTSAADGILTSLSLDCRTRLNSLWRLHKDSSAADDEEEHTSEEFCDETAPPADPEVILDRNCGSDTHQVQPDSRKSPEVAQGRVKNQEADQSNALKDNDLWSCADSELDSAVVSVFESTLFISSPYDEADDTHPETADMFSASRGQPCQLTVKAGKKQHNTDLSRILDNISHSLTEHSHKREHRPLGLMSAAVQSARQQSTNAEKAGLKPSYRFNQGSFLRNFCEKLQLKGLQEAFAPVTSPSCRSAAHSIYERFRNGAQLFGDTMMTVLKASSLAALKHEPQLFAGFNQVCSNTSPKERGPSSEPLSPEPGQGYGSERLQQEQPGCLNKPECSNSAVLGEFCQLDEEIIAERFGELFHSPESFARELFSPRHDLLHHGLEGLYFAQQPSIDTIRALDSTSLPQLLGILEALGCKGLSCFVKAERDPLSRRKDWFDFSLPLEIEEHGTLSCLQLIQRLQGVDYSDEHFDVRQITHLAALDLFDQVTQSVRATAGAAQQERAYSNSKGAPAGTRTGKVEKKSSKAPQYLDLKNYSGDDFDQYLVNVFESTLAVNDLCAEAITRPAAADCQLPQSNPGEPDHMNSPKFQVGGPFPYDYYKIALSVMCRGYEPALLLMISLYNLLFRLTARQQHLKAQRDTPNQSGQIVPQHLELGEIEASLKPTSPDISQTDNNTISERKLNDSCLGSLNSGLDLNELPEHLSYFLCCGVWLSVRTMLKGCTGEGKHWSMPSFGLFVSALKLTMNGWRENGSDGKPQLRIARCLSCERPHLQFTRTHLPHRQDKWGWQAHKRSGRDIFMHSDRCTCCNDHSFFYEDELPGRPA